MTQHEYVFVAISIILGLAITRLLGQVGGLIRAHERIKFHWATALWALCVLMLGPAWFSRLTAVYAAYNTRVLYLTA